MTKEDILIFSEACRDELQWEEHQLVKQRVPPRIRGYEHLFAEVLRQKQLFEQILDYRKNAIAILSGAGLVIGLILAKVCSRKKHKRPIDKSKKKR